MIVPLERYFFANYAYFCLSPAYLPDSLLLIL